MMGVSQTTSDNLNGLFSQVVNLGLYKNLAKRKKDCSAYKNEIAVLFAQTQ